MRRPRLNGDPDVPGDPDAPAVRLDHVTKRFGKRLVLDDVSFDVARGSSFVILGRSGTGKSVLLRHIVALVRPDAGRVFVEGTDITRLKGEALSRVRRRIGFLFQGAALFDSISVGENVAFPLRRHTDLPDAEIERRVREKLAQVGLESEYSRMPAALSGGMRKRAGLARALALDPPLLLVDEPSAGLDPVTSDEIDALLLGFRRDPSTTVIVVTHNISSARRLADHMIMLDCGRVVASGSPAEMMQSRNDLVQAFMASEHAG